jgi:hypothetical protein
MQQQEQTKIEPIETDTTVVVSNPRTDYGDIEGLAADISARGLLEPLIVNEKRELVDGHRRLLALKLNKAGGPGIDGKYQFDFQLVRGVNAMQIRVPKPSILFDLFGRVVAPESACLTTKIPGDARRQHSGRAQTPGRLWPRCPRRRVVR